LYLVQYFGAYGGKYKATAMKHGSLFSGIGGFDLAAQWAGWTNVFQVEWNQYCQAVLQKNFPDAERFTDIRQFDGSKFRGSVDIISGGFPCQPFSSAGKRAGVDDDRYLWPEMLRVIKEVEPRWVVGENVAGILSMDGGSVLAGILTDMENAGYSPEVYSIPALAVGAPHLRQRLWIVAHRNGGNSAISEQPQSRRIESENTNASGENRDIKNPNGSGGKEPRIQQSNLLAKSDCRLTTYPNNNTGERQRRNGGEILPIEEANGYCEGACNSSDPNRAGLQKRKGQPGNNGAQQPPAIGNFWHEHWYDVATRICGMDDGIPGGVDRIGGVPATKTKKGKSHRLEALGNAIVPQVAFQIFDAINKYEQK
jgi:DNA (cytosine-5)-methyltransferase 1